MSKDPPQPNTRTVQKVPSKKIVDFADNFSPRTKLPHRNRPDPRRLPRFRQRVSLGTRRRARPRPTTPRPSTKNSFLIRTRRLITKCFPNIGVLGNYSLATHRNRLIKVVKPGNTNGSALLGTVFNLIHVRRNAIALHNRSVAGLHTSVLIGRKITFIPRAGGIFPSLAVRRGVRIKYCRGPGVFARRFSQIASVFPTLNRHHGRHTNSLSNNRHRVITVNHTLVVRPDILLLSRPDTKLSPTLRSRIFIQIEDVGTANIAIVVIRRGTDQYLRVISHNCILSRNHGTCANANQRLTGSPGIVRLCLNALTGT